MSETPLNPVIPPDLAAVLLADDDDGDADVEAPTDAAMLPSPYEDSENLEAQDDE